MIEARRFVRVSLGLFVAVPLGFALLPFAVMQVVSTTLAAGFSLYAYTLMRIEFGRRHAAYALRDAALEDNRRLRAENEQLQERYDDLLETVRPE